jgi:hypothetical protein
LPFDGELDAPNKVSLAVHPPREGDRACDRKARDLSGGATEGEVAFLKRLRFDGRRPTPLYYYRELQSLRDPLHFRAP